MFSSDNLRLHSACETADGVIEYFGIHYHFPDEVNVSELPSMYHVGSVLTKSVYLSYLLCIMLGLS